MIFGAVSGETDEGRWRNVNETAEHFGVGKGTVYAECAAGRWPHRRVGTYIRAPIRFCPVEDWPVIAELMRPALVTLPVARVPSAAQLDAGMRRMLPRDRLARIDRGMRRRLPRADQ